MCNYIYMYCYPNLINVEFHLDIGVVIGNKLMWVWEADLMIPLWLGVWIFHFLVNWGMNFQNMAVWDVRPIHSSRAVSIGIWVYCRELDIVFISVYVLRCDDNVKPQVLIMQLYLPSWLVNCYGQLRHVSKNRLSGFHFDLLACTHHARVAWLGFENWDMLGLIPTFPL